jgi:hypothetical protein
MCNDSAVTTPESALELVERAFADVERPSNEELLHPQCSDDGDIEDFYEISDWRDLTDADVISGYASLAFFSAAGFRYFIPAYFRYVLRNPDSPEAVVDSTIWSFYPPMYKADIQDFVASKYATLDADQRAAVTAFLEAMEPHNPDALKTLEYWRSQT